MLHGLLTAVQDVAVYVIARRLFGWRAARFAVVLHLGSWFVGYCSVRTYSNSLEASLTAVALTLWPWPLLNKSPQPVKYHSSDVIPSLSVAAVAVLARPTAALMWGPFTLLHMWCVACPGELTPGIRS